MAVGTMAEGTTVAGAGQWPGTMAEGTEDTWAEGGGASFLKHLIKRFQHPTCPGHISDAALDANETFNILRLQAEENREETARLVLSFALRR